MAKKRFTADEIREIRMSPDSARALAERFGVSHPTVLDIRHRRTYKHVADLVDDPHKSPVFRDGTYLRIKALDFMASLPNGYCPTIVTSPPRGMRTVSEFEPQQERVYVAWQRKVIAECRRVAGSEGIFIYHWVREEPASKYQDAMLKELGMLADEETDRCSRGWVIIWNHGPPEVASGSSRTDHPVKTHSDLFVFPGAEWSMPVGKPASRSSDVWNIPATYESADPSKPIFSDELAASCISLGQGRVFDPFANTGAIP